MSQTAACQGITNQSRPIWGKKKVSLEDQGCYGASGRWFLLLSIEKPWPFTQVQMSSRWPDYHTWLLLGITYLTEREKSPGALSLSLMRKAPSCLCLPNISSAFARGIFPKNHLCSEEKKTIGKVKSLDPSVEKPDVDIPTEIKWFLTETITMHLAATLTGYQTMQLLTTFSPGNEATMTW